MREILIYSLPLWLLLLGIVLLLVSGSPILRRKTLDLQQTQFKSLRTTSPILNALVMTSVVGKPFLEHLRKNDWDTSVLAPQIMMPLTVCSSSAFMRCSWRSSSSSFARSKT